MKEILIFEESGRWAEHILQSLVKNHPDKIARCNKAFREITLINGDRIKCYWQDQRTLDGLSGDILINNCPNNSYVGGIISSILIRSGELWTMQEIDEYMEDIT